MITAIKKIQEVGKRADFDSVPVPVEKQHSLARTVTFQHLESMIAKNTISSIHYRGKPSLHIPKHSERSEKERKMSNDEEHLSEFREELEGGGAWGNGGNGGSGSPHFSKSWSLIFARKRNKFGGGGGSGRSVKKRSLRSLKSEQRMVFQGFAARF